MSTKCKYCYVSECEQDICPCKCHNEKIKEDILKLVGLQDTLRDIEKTKLFNHVPFEEYALTLERLFDLTEATN